MKIEAPPRFAAASTDMRPTSQVSLVAVCKPWRGPDAAHQDAALASWARLKIPVVLCGRDDGVADACRRWGFLHEPDVRTGTELDLNSAAPLLPDVLAAGARHADGLLCLINADIIVCPDFADRLSSLVQRHGRDAFIVGRRRNFAFGAYDDDAEGDPRCLMAHSELHPPTGADFFAFRHDFFDEPIPEFVLGRPAFDNWLMWMACEYGRPAIDASESIVTFHPAHEYDALMAEAGRPGEKRPRTHWPDAPAVIHNRRLVGDRIGLLTDPRWLRC